MSNEVKSEFIREWESATKNLGEYFSAKYFGNGAESYWIANEVGGVLCVNDDYFFGLSDILDYIKYKYTPDKMFEYYHYRLECNDKKELPIKIKNYKKLKK